MLRKMKGQKGALKHKFLAFLAEFIFSIFVKRFTHHLFINKFRKETAILGLEFSLKILCIYDVVKIAANSLIFEIGKANSFNN